jgi:hypothetical protein
MDNMQWHLENQGQLQKIYKEKRYQISLSKNRLEKYRQREKNKNKILVDINDILCPNVSI